MQQEDDLDGLTDRVISCAMTVHRELGPGLLESVYSECLELELVTNGLRVERERRVRTAADEGENPIA